jgi:hypothetical protein
MFEEEEGWGWRKREREKERKRGGESVGGENKETHGERGDSIHLNDLQRERGVKRRVGDIISIPLIHSSEQFSLHTNNNTTTFYKDKLKDQPQ